MTEEITDKIKFKLTIPNIIGIVGLVAAVCAGYYYLIAQITDVNVRVAQVYLEVQNGNKEHQTFLDKLDDHENRIRAVEKKVR